ncbi:MAG: hydantoinase B/oxoprolinase family protein [Planctomycetes bacterium]|nr:hydantoinase B/oxoprolinase family protein [Planctomycetota bacterium]
MDTGGTFTDCVARASDGQVCRAKVLSTSALRGVVKGCDGNVITVRLAVELTAEEAANFFNEFRAIPVERAGVNRSSEAEFPVISGARWVSDGVIECRFESGNSQSVARAEIFPKGVFVDLVAPFEAPILAVRLAIARPFPMPLEDCRICVGTTRGTNALLQGRVSRVALFVNEGLEDILRIGDQRRLDIFAQSPSKPPALERCSVGVRARMSKDGSEIVALDEGLLRTRARERVAAGERIAAVAMLHAAVNAAHEIRAGEILREEGFNWVSLAHRCGSSSRFEPRARAAVVDAALSEPVGEFIGSIQRGAAGAEVLMMTSAGGLTPASAFAPRESLLSGPAGGVAAAAAVAGACGFARCVTLDMGGTSADVARVDGVAEMRDETTVGPATIASACVAVESVAAGGGSICWWDGDALRVGPQSAGASPGPACYGSGGPLTLTDAHLLLGRIDPVHLPIPVSIEASRRCAECLRDSIAQSREAPLSMDDMLRGFVAIADEAMAAAIRTVTVRRGIDPADHALVAFGGAGGLHACAIAERLGMKAVIVPADAGLMCASGISRAPITRIESEVVLAAIDRCEPSVKVRLRRMLERAKSELIEIGMDSAGARPTRRVALMRLSGQEESLDVELPLSSADALDAETLRVRFTRRFRQTYGFDPDPSRAIEIERLRLLVALDRGDATGSKSGFIDAPPRFGPAVLMKADSTAFLAPGWSAKVHASGATIFLRDAELRSPDSADPRAGAQKSARTQSMTTGAGAHELIAARLGSIATDMGEQLRRTAVSANIKDRLDFSCGLLDAGGFLVVNAPHIPIHLGALGACVRSLLPICGFAPNQAWVVNHPRFGGSHLPDLTVITPIFSAQSELIGFAANRAHHAEIGGTRPGSMPPDATTLAHEGVVIEPTLVVEDGVAHLDRVERLLRGGTWPSRMVSDNLADLAAQLAANALAVARVRSLALESTMDALRASCERLRLSARHAAERAIQTLPVSVDSMEEKLDDGTSLRIRLRRSDNPTGLTIDFTGTSAQHPNNLNAPRAVTRAAVMYSIRVLVGRLLGGSAPAFPMNEGLLDPIELILPEGTILSPIFDGPPERCPACAIGQTETSQRLVDLLWRAFHLAACSQGTINNLLFGNARFGFYETIAGGAGATAERDGESGVHTHISNTRITDAEVLERRYPVRLEQFSIRRDSGGAGKHKGGDGLVRRLRFLEAVDLSFLSQHRVEAPYGLEGGASGRRGEQRIIRTDGSKEDLPGIVAARCEAGDQIEIETPGGGGFGAVP